MLIVNCRFLTQPITGVQRYAIEISRQLKRLNVDIYFVAPRNILHKELAVELDVEIVGRLTGHLWEQVELPLYLKEKGGALLLNLANTAPLFYNNNIVTLHDVAFERFPQTFSWKFRLAYRLIIPKIVKSARLLITDSAFSADEISECYGYSRNEIHIVSCAVSDSFAENVIEAQGNYILSVSSLNYQKNFHSLVKAFNLLKDKSLKLCLVGAINRNFADHRLLQDLDSNPNIEFLGRVSDERLVGLYSSAQCFIYPSLYEGFGIPPLEAQANGCPCIVSNVASLPEVCGDSVVYCDPYSVEDIRNKIQLVLSDKILGEELRKKGFENIKRFSWEGSAKKILSIIEMIK